MTTKELIHELQTKEHSQFSSAVKGALYYRLYMSGLSGNDIANLFGCYRQAVYKMIYDHRDKVSIKDAVVNKAVSALEEHDIVVLPIIKNLKCAGYELTVDGEECLKTKCK